jgi:ribosomal protein L37AE/L43A
MHSIQSDSNELFRSISVEVKLGSQITVGESQSAYLCREGAIVESFGPGTHSLKPESDRSTLGALTGSGMPGSGVTLSRIIFISNRILTDLKWGTRQPITVKDEELGFAELRAFGTYALKLMEPGSFARVVAAHPEWTSQADLVQFLSNSIVRVFAESLAAHYDGFFKLNERLPELQAMVREKLGIYPGEYSLEITDFFIQAIDPSGDFKTRVESLWICQSCGSKANTGDDEKCQKCGESKETVVKEGVWDCPNCGSKGNRGSFKCCRNCGKPRGEDVEFYLPDDARVVTDLDELQKASRGPDWKCQYCGGDNRADFSHCTGCGSPGEGAPLRAVKEERLDGKPPAPSEPPPVKKSPFGLIACGCLSIFALFMLIGIILCWPKASIGTVSGHRWERSVDIERNVTVTESAWEREVPTGARIVSRSRELHHNDRVQTGTVTKTRTVKVKVQSGTEKVKTGQKDMGNGYFKETYETRPVYKEESRTETYQDPVYKEVPVYKMKMTYQIDRWQISTSARLAGDDRNARWPAVRPESRQREGAKKEAYYVLFTGPKGESFTYKAANVNEWQGFEKGQKYRVRVNNKGNVTKIEK